jgi:hypothetical protein
MGHDPASRRQVMSSLGAAALALDTFAAQGHSANFDLRRDAPSRLQQSTSHDYTPPTDLPEIADVYRRMTLAVRINGAGPFEFVVDTGANQSVIAGELADQLGLPTGPTTPLNGVAGIENAATTTARLAIGRRDVASQTFSLLPRAGIGGDGMLGLDSIGRGALTLDFVRQSLRIDSGFGNWRDPDAVAVKAVRRDGQLTLVKVSIGSIGLTAFIDSGAQSTIGNMMLRQLAITRGANVAWAGTTIISSTGQSMTAEIADLPDLRVGSLRLPVWPVAFADLHTFQMWNLVDAPALILGVDILSRFESVCIDFARNEVRFVMPRSTRLSGGFGPADAHSRSRART